MTKEGGTPARATRCTATLLATPSQPSLPRRPPSSHHVTNAVPAFDSEPALAAAGVLEASGTRSLLEGTKPVAGRLN